MIIKRNSIHTGIAPIVIASLFSIFSNTASATDGVQQVATVYQHVNFRGRSLSVGEGDISIRNLKRSRVGNDRISSIEIAPGYEVLACQNGRLRGRCEIFTSSESDLRTVSFNDTISSLRVSKISPVTIYQHVNFMGSAVGIDEGEVTIQDLKNSAVGNDRISSIQIDSGYQVTACSNHRLRGRCETFTSTASDLRTISFNDTISSLRVEKTIVDTVIVDTGNDEVEISCPVALVSEIEEVLGSETDPVNDPLSVTDLSDSCQIFSTVGGFASVSLNTSGVQGGLQGFFFQDGNSTIEVPLTLDETRACAVELGRCSNFIANPMFQ